MLPSYKTHISFLLLKFDWHIIQKEWSNFKVQVKHCLMNGKNYLWSNMIYISIHCSTWFGDYASVWNQIYRIFFSCPPHQIIVETKQSFISIHRFISNQHFKYLQYSFKQASSHIEFGVSWSGLGLPITVRACSGKTWSENARMRLKLNWILIKAFLIKLILSMYFCRIEIFRYLLQNSFQPIGTFRWSIRMLTSMKLSIEIMQQLSWLFVMSAQVNKEYFQPENQLIIDKDAWKCLIYIKDLVKYLWLFMIGGYIPN